MLQVIAATNNALTEANFDEGVANALNRLPEYGALAVLDEIMGNDLGSVRNASAYIMGICKRHRERGGAH